MPAAAPQIDAVTGSNPPNGTPIVIGATVQLSNADIGGELTYLWEWLDKPEGSLSAFSNPAIENPTFVADSEGTYLIRLTVNATLGDEEVAKVIVGVAQEKSAMRIPAAGESTEHSTLRGWALQVNRNLQLLDRLFAKPSAIVGYSSDTFSTGKVGYISGQIVTKTGLPGEEVVPGFTRAYANVAADMTRPLFVFLSTVDGSGSAAAGDFVIMQRWGMLGPIALGAGAVGDPLYVNNTADLSLTPGTYPRRVGWIADIDGADYWIELDTHDGHHEGTLNLQDGAEIRQVTGPLTFDAVTGADDINFKMAGTTVWIIDTSGDLGAAGASRLIHGVLTPVAGTDAANKDYVDAAGVAGSSVLVWGNTDTPNAVTIAALDPGFGIRTSPAVAGSFPQIRAPRTGTFSKLYVRCQTGPVTQGIDITVYIQNVATSITCLLAAGATEAADTTHTAAVALGDKIDIRVEGVAGITAGAIDITATLLFGP